MSYIKPFMTEAFAGSTLERLDGGSAFLAFKLTPNKRFHWCYIMVTPLGLMIGGDQRFGESASGVAIATGYGLDTFLKGDEEYLGSKFFGRKPTGKVALSRWMNDVGWMAALRQEFVRLYPNALEKALTPTA